MFCPCSARPGQRRNRTYRLNLGPVGNSDGAYECESHFERVCRMWALRMCRRPVLAWFNDSADPGIVKNTDFRPGHFVELSDRHRSQIVLYVIEENRMSSRCDAESGSLELSVLNLLSLCRGFMRRLSFPEARKLGVALNDVRSWVGNYEPLDPCGAGWTALGAGPKPF